MRVELTVTAKGQITLRQAVLDHLGIKPGDHVDVELLPDGRVELRPAGTRPKLARLRGMLRRPGQTAVTLQEMQEAIEQGRGGSDEG
ncbi:AbrB family looped-hinge helix DNA binding protein [Azospirillum lipoferum]|uniref:AbrB/MazE/SpoVT family DNA-binding domain-containing protein n=1 Tax=Azospirillum lipoferum TaxID=193 RepID=A0A5A9GPM7_AZOLI|nr:MULTISPECIES: AbrB/MazE/SpoVT family DNA-binding domain-containing protein [Azospirillum]KAA0595775.1 AbrB/MazE/SpoVT family DNA-binding domain-containing protein [Azospirillum lipoferum]MCP1611353.1 AbrB family looped-hinge helix DNA binding protein [Azospirillum lipoferum]MDW5537157.1 AbrB/MazE/SpoVT family DNA-binding domain-containing protein [Azospirillum sp. NL1]